MRKLSPWESFLYWIQDDFEETLQRGHVTRAIKAFGLTAILFPFLVIGIFATVWISRSAPTRDPYGGSE